LGAAGRVPSVAFVHNAIPHEQRAFDRTFTTMVLRRLSGAVVHSQAVADDIVALVPSLRTEVIAMPPLVEHEAAPLPLAPPYRLLFFGFVRPYKGLDIALDAVRMLLDRGHPVQLTVAGEFWQPVEEWRDQVAQRGLTSAVVLRPGYVSDEQIGDLFAEHHLVIAPYRSASQSAVVPMAFHAGRAVVVTDVGGLAEDVTDGVNGTVAPAGDPTAFAAAVERALAVLPDLTGKAASERRGWDAVVATALRVGSL
jgi:glycosyltransferase involved in cell wall biosynthesis